MHPFGKMDPPPGEYSSDSAYVLQTGDLHPEEIAETLVIQNYPAMYRLARLVLGSQQENKAKTACIRAIQQAVQLTTIQSPAKYSGECSPLAWLYALLLKFLPIPRAGLIPGSHLSLPAETTSALQVLPPQLVIPFIVLLLDNLDTRDLAFMMGIEPRQAELMQIKLLNWLNSHPLELGKSSKPGKEIQATDHLKTIFPLEEITPGETAALVRNILKSPPANPLLQLSSMRTLDWVLVGMLITAVVAGIFYLNRTTTPQALNPLFPTSTPTPSLPTPIVISAGEPLFSPQKQAALTGLYANQLDLSATGVFLVFRSNMDNWVPGDTNHADDIFFFDRRMKTYERVSVDTRGQQSNGHSSYPSISDDGMIIAFSSFATNLDNRVNLACDQNPGTCPNVFYRNRHFSFTRQVSVSPTGQPANGASYLPVLTQDGQWIFFWSSATNLVLTPSPTCPPGENTLLCFDLFAYHIPTQSMQRIPVGKKSIESLGKFPVQASADGRKLLVLINQGDAVAESLNLTFPYDTYLFDRTDFTFSPINFKVDSEPGNQPVFNASISASGETIIFTSYADNLIPAPQDTNQTADVFVKHLASKLIQRVSVRTNGKEVFSPSGIYPDSPAIQNTPGQITDNGRVVLFLSTAEELSEENHTCYPNAPAACTTSFYLHNRFGKITQSIRELAAKNNYEATQVNWYREVAISSNGDWLAAVIEKPCTLVCQEISIYSVNSSREIRLVPPEASPNPPLWVHETVTWLPGAVENQQKTEQFILSPSLEWAARWGKETPLELWAIPAGREPRLLQGTNWGTITSATFSPESTRLALGNLDGEVFIVTLGTPASDPDIAYERTTLTFSLPGNGAPVTSLAFSPRGDALAVASSDAVQGISVWSLTLSYAYMVHRFPGLESNLVVFSPDSRMLLSVIDSTQLWIRDITDYPLIGWNTLDGNDHVHAILDLEEPVAQVVLSPDSQLLVVGTENGSLGVWQLSRSRSGVLFPTLLTSTRLAGRVFLLAFTGDSNTLVAATPESLAYFTARAGQLENQVLLNPVQQLIGGTLGMNNQLYLVSRNGYLHILSPEIP